MDRWKYSQGANLYIHKAASLASDWFGSRYANHAGGSEDLCSNIKKMHKSKLYRSQIATLQSIKKAGIIIIPRREMGIHTIYLIRY